VKLLKLLVPLAALLLGGCQKNIQNNEAVRQAVVKYVGTRGLSVDAMDITISSVTFKDNEAEAMVAFTPKGGGTNNGMTMKYSLVRKGAEWEVVKKPNAGSGHGNMAMPPSGMGGAMPPSGMGGSMPPMPADHPPMGAAQAPAKK